MFRFFRWLFGIKDEEESTENNNTNDVQKKQHSEIYELKKDVINLQKEAIASRKRNDTSEQTMRNLNSRLEMLEDAEASNFNTVEEMTAELQRLQQEHDEKVEKDKPKKSKKSKVSDDEAKAKLDAIKEKHKNEM